MWPWFQLMVTECPFSKACSLLFVLFTERLTMNWLEIQDGGDQFQNGGNFRVFVCQPETRHKTLVAIFEIYSSNTKKLSNMSKLVRVPFNRLGNFFFLLKTLQLPKGKQSIEFWLTSGLSLNRHLHNLEELHLSTTWSRIIFIFTIIASLREFP